jgi:hypothetical protein
MCLEGDVPTSACDLLRDLILDDPESLDLYVHYLSDSISLRCVVSSPVDSKAMALALAGDAPFDIPAGVPAVLPPQDISLTFGSSSTASCNTLGYFSSGWPVAYLVATVIFGIGLAIGAYTYVSHPGKSVVSRSNPESLIPNPSPKAPSVGQITGMDDCQWADSNTAPIAADVRLGQKYQLASGLMEITYDTGAKVILQGPVTYEVETRNGGFLSLGKLTGKVEAANAKGFAVRTSTATVTDLGTEFGVEVLEGGDSEIHVMVGAVDVAPQGGGRQVRLSAADRRNAAHVESDSHNIILMGACPSHFVTAMPLPRRTRIVGSPLGWREFKDNAEGYVFVDAEESIPIDGTVTRYTFSDNNKCVPARSITPLIFAREGEKRFVLTGIGESFTSVANGIQRAPFRLVVGSADVKAGKHTFGHFDGTVEAHGTGMVKILSRNAGVVDAGTGGPWRLCESYRYGVGVEYIKLGDVLAIHRNPKDNGDGSPNRPYWLNGSILRSYSAQLTVQGEK